MRFAKLLWSDDNYSVTGVRRRCVGLERTGIVGAAAASIADGLGAASSTTVAAASTAAAVSDGAHLAPAAASTEAAGAGHVAAVTSSATALSHSGNGTAKGNRRMG